MARSFSRGRLSKFTKLWGMQPLARAVIVVAAVAVLATGVTYAALQSPGATLTGNTISTATADLRIGATASTFSTTRAGFSFGGVIPGSTPAPTDGNTFYLKNYGTAPLSLKVAINSIPNNSSNVDLSKVYFVFNRVDTLASNAGQQKFSVAALVAANAAGGLSLNETVGIGTNATAQYKAQVAMDEDAFAGTTASIVGVDLVFTGTVVSQ